MMINTVNSAEIIATSEIIGNYNRSITSFDIDEVDNHYISPDTTTVATISIDLTSKKTKYYSTSIFTKRGAEALHVAIWLIKDYLWIRAVDWRAMLSVGILCTLFMLALLIDDIVDLFRSRNQKKYVQWEIIKEIVAGLGALIWIIGSVLWATGECYDLRHTGGYNDVYFYYTHISLYVIMGATIMLSIFWCTVFVVEMFGLSKRVYRRRLARLAQHKVLTGKKIPFAGIFDSESDGEDSVITSNKGECLCRNKVNNNDAVAKIDVSGMPYMCPGFVIVPQGLPNWKTGEVIHDSRYVVWTWRGIISFRDYENLSMYLWLIKDLMWLYEDPIWARVFWVISVILISIVALDVAATTIFYSKSCDVPLFNIVTSLLMVGWIAGNIVWCGGEIFLPELSGDGIEDVDERINKLIPPLLSPISEVPSGAWGLRWAGSWILFLSLLTIIFSGLYFIFVDLYNFIKDHRAKRVDTSIK